MPILQLNSRSIQNYLGIGLIVCTILFATSIGVAKLIKQGVENNVQTHLEAIQHAVHETMHYWRDSNIEAAAGVANRNIIKQYVRELVKSDHKAESLRRNQTLAKLRTELSPFIEQHNFTGFFIVARNQINYGSMRNNNLGVKNLLLDLDTDSLLRGFAGETVVSRPVESDVPLKDKNGNMLDKQHSLFVVTPVSNHHDNIIALLMFRIPAGEHFEKILSVGRFGKSGETYIFNKQGLLLSPSRFEIPLMQSGLIRPDSSSASQLVLRQPEGNITKNFRPSKNHTQQPLTQPVEQTLLMKSHISLQAEHDYRGVEVVSIGKWDESEDMGFVTQLDYREAFNIYITTRNTISLVTAISALLLFLLVASLIYSRHAALQLVQKRTAQIKQQNQTLHKEIDDRRKAEQSMQHTQTRTDAILFSAFDAIIATDENGIIELANPSAESIFGYDKDELLGKNVKTLMPDNIGRQHDELIHKHKTGLVSTIVGRRREMVAQRKDGSTFPIELAVEETIIDNTKYFTSTINDISERKELIERISSSEKEYKSIVNNLSDAYYRTNQDGEIIMTTPAVKQLLGYRIEEIIGMKLSKLYVDPQGRDKFLKTLNDNNGSVIDYEAQLQRKDGIVIWVSTNAHYYTDEYGNTLGVEGTTRDITARKLAEEELRESRQRLSFHIKQTPLGVIEWDVDFKVIEWNPAAESIFGYSRNEAIGRHAAELIIPDEFKPHVDDIWYALLGQRGGQHSTNQNINKRGETIWCEWYNTPILNEDMNVIGVASMVMDVTTRKKVEEILTRDHEQLEALVESRTEELNMARLEAEHANAAKSDFLANMSHELRTPMHTILSFAEMGMKKSHKLTKEKLVKYFTNIHQGGERQLALLNDLLDLSKLESGSTTYEFYEFDIQDVINEQIAQHEVMLTNKNLKLKFDPGPVDSHFSFDRVRIEQVIRNLLSNAIKFSKERSTITLILGIGETQQLHDTQPALIVSVSDEGVGIPEDELESIFDKFSQSSKTRSKAGGTGLGLAICQEIITAHGGLIWAENNAHGGARFCFSLPLIHTEQTASIPDIKQK